MTNYFSNFPLVDYNGKKSINLSLSLRIKNIVNSSEYFYYTIRDGERPDTIANDYYGDSKLAWLVLLSNEIMDVYSDWPLSNEAFDDYIIKKYGSISQANTTIHHYKKTTEVLYFLLSDPEVIIDLNEYLLQSDKSQWSKLSYDPNLQISPSSYSLVSDPTNYLSVTAYEYEFADNEEKRVIKLIQRENVQSIISSLKDKLQNG